MKRPNPCPWLAMGVVASVAAFRQRRRPPQATLDAVKKRGKILCGVSPVAAGFSFADDKGVRRGFDQDVCRAVSAAVFGDPDKVELVPLSTNVRFQGLQSGEVDILSRQTTWTFSRDTSLGLDFGPVVFYDGQGIMVPAKLNVKSASELGSAVVACCPARRRSRTSRTTSGRGTSSMKPWCSRIPTSGETPTSPAAATRSRRTAPTSLLSARSPRSEGNT